MTASERSIKRAFGIGLFDGYHGYDYLRSSSFSGFDAPGFGVIACPGQCFAWIAMLTGSAFFRVIVDGVSAGCVALKALQLRKCRLCGQQEVCCIAKFLGAVLRRSGKILHLFGWDKKFVPSFIDFVRQSFVIEEHHFIVYGVVDDENFLSDPNVTYYPSLLRSIFSVLAQMRQADRIILHGLFNSHLLYALALHPWVLRKCFWAIWGGDIYIHDAENRSWRWRKDEWLRRFLIPRMGHFITHIEGDYQLAQKWYGAKGQWHECFMYTSNLYKEYGFVSKPHESTNILLGNSATSSNNHLEVLEKLRPFSGSNVRIYCPLSYGDAAYADRVAKAGEALFGEKFIALRDFMPFEQYLELLTNVDIAVFNHNRQQGVGNITSLLGLGKKVYIRKNVTTWRMLERLGVSVFDVSQIDLSKLDRTVAESNHKIIEEAFSVDRLKRQWLDIYE